MFNYRHIFVINFFILAIGLQQIQAEENPEVIGLQTYFYRKCLNNTGTRAAFEMLNSDTFRMETYFKYAYKFLPDNTTTFCKSKRSNLEFGIYQIAYDLKPCLMQEETYLADFIEESFSELLNFFCHNSGEYTRRFFSSEGTQCRKKIEKSDLDVENCLNRIFLFSPTRTFTKNGTCDDVTAARKCFAQLLEVHCPNSNDFKGLNDVFFNFVGKPCNNLN